MKTDIYGKVKNKEGEDAYLMTPKEELISIVATCLVGEPKFYDSPTSEVLSSIRKVLDEDPEFVLKTALYVRNELHLRMVPLVMVIEYANYKPGTVPGARKYVSDIISRADEITTLIELQLSRNAIHARSNILPMVIKNGIASAFNKFDEYNFAKYKYGKGVSMRDALFMTHPRPKESQRETFNRIANNTLPTPDTWESIISRRGASKESWEEAIPHMGYMALLRNLRNFIRHGIDMHMVIPVLSASGNVLKSKQLPFRFLSAYRAVEILSGEFDFDAEYVLDGLNIALRASMENLPHISGTSVILIDVSGSMNCMISERGSVSCKDIAALFGAMTRSMCDNSIVMPFASETCRIDLSGDLMQDVSRIEDLKIGGCTYAHKPIQYCIEDNIECDRVILFSDEQCYGGTSYYNRDGSFEKSMETLHDRTHCKLFSIDLTGYGTSIMPLSNQWVNKISGWSDGILKYISLDKNAMINDIQKYRGG